MKIIRWAAGAGALALVLAAGVLAASAAGLAAAGPEEAPYLDTQVHTLAPHDSTWYRLDFVLERPNFLCHFIGCADREVYHGRAVITLPGLAKSGLAFEVYAPSQIQVWRKVDPIGRSNTDGSNLTWAGDGNESGTWYVRVVNDMDYPIDYQFAIDGVRISLSPPPDTTPQQPPLGSLGAVLGLDQGPTPTPTPVVGNTVPDRAGGVDGASHTLAPHSELWYIVGFPLDWVTVKLLGAAGSGLSFEVYAPSQVGDWWKEDPLGRGSVDGNDLVWTGGPDGSDRRYIRVVNKTGQAVAFTLRVELPYRQPSPKPFDQP